MKVWHFFRQESDKPLRTLLIIIALSGFSNSLLLVVINIAAAKIANQQLEIYLFFLFMVTFILFVAAQHYALTRSSALIESAVIQVRLRVADKLRHSTLQYMEQEGTGSLYSHLIHHTDTLSNAAIELGLMVQSAMLVAVAFIYLSWLSPLALVIYLFFFSIAATIYYLYNNEIIHQLKEVRAREENFLTLFQHLIAGFKELKLHQAKSDDLFEDLEQIASENQSLRIGTRRREGLLVVYGRSVFYLLLAVMVFAVPVFSEVYSSDIYELVATNLFIMGPIGSLVAFLPRFNRIQLAVTYLRNLEKQLGRVQELQKQPAAVQESFQTLQLINVSFDYLDEQGQTLFSLRDLNFSLHRGEMVFLVGGNGSGKTTLLKLLTGLYYPTMGEIQLNGRRIFQPEYPQYRQFFASVFVDFHLFHKLYGLEKIAVKEVNAFLKKLEMDHKTRYTENGFTQMSLSTGQRKRLAFAVACLEDKPIYIFDELAADQDPNFRRRFYQEFLPELKAQGKTIIAVSHDDRYFDLADRVIKLEKGTPIEITSPAQG